MTDSLDTGTALRSLCAPESGVRANVSGTAGDYK
jgi:hypothetical protein